METPSRDFWSLAIKLAMLIAVIGIAVGGMLASAVYMVDADHRGEPPSSVPTLVIMCIPPLLLIVLTILGRAELENAGSEDSKGEIAQLLQRKQAGALRVEPHPSTRSDHALFASPANPPLPENKEHVLDQLLARQRRRRLKKPPLLLP